MKRITVSALVVLAMVLSACEKEKTKDIKPLILGTWYLDKIIEEEYQPINVLTYHDVEIGKRGDSVTFNTDNTYLVYTDGSGMADEEEYNIIGDDKIEMEGELYHIVNLTDTTFHLQEEETDRATNEKWVYKILLKR